jgi:glycosyltransferase involved in cell wall biosynthesis
MACGVPCVVTDVGDSALIVRDTGRVVPPQNPQALAAAWREIIEMGPKQRRELGRAGRQRVEEQFSLPAIVTRYERLYSKVGKISSRKK